VTNTHLGSGKLGLLQRRGQHRSMRPFGFAWVTNPDARYTDAQRHSGHVPQHQDILTKQNTMTAHRIEHTSPQKGSINEARVDRFYQPAL
jgi:hypothetical protein